MMGWAHVIWQRRLTRRVAQLGVRHGSSELLERFIGSTYSRWMGAALVSEQRMEKVRAVQCSDLVSCLLLEQDCSIGIRGNKMYEQHLKRVHLSRLSPVMWGWKSGYPRRELGVPIKPAYQGMGGLCGCGSDGDSTGNGKFGSWSWFIAVPFLIWFGLQIYGSR